MHCTQNKLYVNIRSLLRYNHLPFRSVQVISQGKSWTVRRTLREFCFLDRQCHTCVFDRAFSKLRSLNEEEDDEADFEEQENLGPNSAANNGQNCQVGQVEEYFALQSFTKGLALGCEN